MSLDIHTLALVKPTSPAKQDRVVMGFLPNVASPVGSAAGASVTVAVAFPGGLPASYSVNITTNQDAVAFVSGKTNKGFNVTLNPRLATNTLAAGTFDVQVLA